MGSALTPRYQTIDGVKYSYGYTPELVRQALSYMPRDGDIVMVSYLKCGNNWLQQILQLVLHKCEPAKTIAEYHKRTPYLEMVGTHEVECMKAPRFYKTHLAYGRQPINPKAKYIYLTRNPLDVCVSFFHFSKMMPCYEYQTGTFEDFFELFVTGATDRGDFLDHVQSWYSHRNDANVFFVTYEELKRNFRKTVTKLAYFLGEEYGVMLEANEPVFRDLENKSSVAYMSELLEITPETIRVLLATGNVQLADAFKRFVFDSSGTQRTTNLVRKGVVGDWRNHFTQEQLDRLRNRIKEKNFVGTLTDLWTKEHVGRIV